MRVIRHVAELQQLADSERSLGRRIGLVPTMGALHAGHLSMVEEARRRTDRVWLSIFVNPTQFNDPKDMDAYPSTFEDDLRACREAGVDVVFAPGPDEMYDPDCQTWVDVDDITRPLCGAARPGHFRGVITIVTKLLLAAKPHVAVFGEKDFQQLAVIRRMVRDLGFDVEIVAGPIVREADGLALSSRNVNLDAEARRQSLVLCQALDAAERAVAAGETRTEALLQLVRQEIGKAPRAEIDYAELRDSASLEAAPPELTRATLLALAVFIRPPGAAAGTTVRLIDNRVLRPQQ